jgi:CheY-like chemotaxis protein
MSQPDSPRSPTVLLIDDEPVILRCVRAALAADYKLLEADTSLKALEVSENFRGTIDLLMADHTLKGATGQEVIDKIRSARPEVRVLYFSSYSRGHPANRGLPANAEILEKPFLPRDLRGAMFRALRNQPPDKTTAADAGGSTEIDCAIYVRNPECLETLRDEIFRSRSLFGRLIMASKLWNWGKNRYEHRLSNRYSCQDVDDAMRLVHHEALVSWLSFSLRQQKADVSIYLEGVSHSAAEVHRLQALGKAALPQTAIEAERQFFLSQLSVIQRLLQFQPSGECEV